MTEVIPSSQADDAITLLSQGMPALPLSGYPGKPEQTSGQTLATLMNGSSITVQDVYLALMETRVEVMELKIENLSLKQTVNDNIKRVTALEQQQLDNLNQHIRREADSFNKFKVNKETIARHQINGFLDAIRVQVKSVNLVDAHLLPYKRGKRKRCSIRFKDRKLTQKVMLSRKKTV